MMQEVLIISGRAMPWYNKVHWKEGLFLRPHHFQQNDRYHEHLLEARTRVTSPYPWGFLALEIDRDLAAQGKFGLRRAAGVLQDGTPFDLPMDSPLPAPIDIPENAQSKQLVWLCMPMATPNSREVAEPERRERQPLRRGRGDLSSIRHLRAPDRGGAGDRPAEAVPRAAQDAKARLRVARHRAHPRNPRQIGRAGRRLCAAGADLLRPCRSRWLDGPGDRLD